MGQTYLVYSEQLQSLWVTSSKQAASLDKFALIDETHPEFLQKAMVEVIQTARNKTPLSHLTADDVKAFWSTLVVCYVKRNPAPVVNNKFSLN